MPPIRTCEASSSQPSAAALGKRPVRRRNPPSYLDCFIDDLCQDLSQVLFELRTGFSDPHANPAEREALRDLMKQIVCQAVSARREKWRDHWKGRLGHKEMLARTQAIQDELLASLYK